MSDQYSFEDQGDVVALRTAWQQVMGHARSAYGEVSIKRFLGSLEPVQFEGGVARFRASSLFVAEWVREKYGRDLDAWMSEALETPVRIEIEAEIRDTPRVGVATATATIRKDVSTTEAPRFQRDLRYRFDNFIGGSNNRVALAGAKNVASEPGRRFNPFFIYGPSGLGKTHLLHAIANEVLDRDPRFPVLYINAQSFLEQFVHALQHGRVDVFRRSHRNVGMWLLDDIQLIMGKDKTQEEVFHTFNWLYQNAKQIVLCSDRPPRELMSFSDRLRTRLESGLVADIAPPDTETRIAILRMKAQERKVEFADGVDEYLATQLAGSVRRLEGALITAQAEAMAQENVITQLMAERAVQAVRGTLGGVPRVDQILELVSDFFEVSVEELKGPSRRAHIAQARHVAIFLIKQITNGSWKQIGVQMGHRDHTTVLHGFRKIHTQMDKDRDLNDTINKLMSRANTL